MGRRFKKASMGLAIVGVILISKPVIKYILVRTGDLLERRRQRLLKKRYYALAAEPKRADKCKWMIHSNLSPQLVFVAELLMQLPRERNLLMQLLRERNEWPVKVCINFLVSIIFLLYMVGSLLWFTDYIYHQIWRMVQAEMAMNMIVVWSALSGNVTPLLFRKSTAFSFLFFFF